MPRTPMNETPISAAFPYEIQAKEGRAAAALSHPGVVGEKADGFEPILPS
ncbi:MAG: hypothetical protein AB7O37_10405 [Vicinamibacteria bacterium]